MSAVPVEITFDGIDAGWANATLAAGDHAYRMEGFSYTSPAFAELARFGTDIALDALAAEVHFSAEQGDGWSWVLQETFYPPPSTSSVTLSVFKVSERFDAISKRSELVERLEVFSLDVERDQLAGAVLAAFVKLEAEMGIEAFEQAWCDPYPSRGVEALRAAMSTARRTI